MAWIYLLIGNLMFCVSAVIDLSVDELETEESILLYARHNSIENVGSPVAPPFSPVTQISPDFNR